MASNIAAKVFIHPIVFFQIIDAHDRRRAKTPRVVGALLGTRWTPGGHLEITNSFCIIHKEHADNVEADLTYATEMYEMLVRVCPAEKIVGWYSTGAINSHSLVIHEYYMRECEDPVHLTVDTSLKGGKLGMHAYVSVVFGVPGGTKGRMFTPIPLEITQEAAEMTAMQLVSKTNMKRVVKLDKSEWNLLMETVKNLEHKLSMLLCYVEDVLARKQRPNATTGRQLMDLINSVPLLKPEEFCRIINENIRDMLLSITLSSLVRVQLELNEKLSNMPDQ